MDPGEPDRAGDEEDSSDHVDDERQSAGPEAERDQVVPPPATPPCGPLPGVTGTVEESNPPEPVQEFTEPVQESTEPVQESTEPVQESTEPVQESTEPVQE
eukprot:Hpha_TRINITY_DN2184_c0_g1::TRINITY_DN2184_c0_g1_i1::g.42313::m.42313